MSRVRWLAFVRRGETAATLHAVPQGSDESLCGHRADPVLRRVWVEPAPGLPRHRDCERRVAALVHKGQCPATGKVRFDSEQDAALAVTEAKVRASLRNDRKRREQRSYRCGECGGWHLTSQQKAAKR